MSTPQYLYRASISPGALEEVRTISRQMVDVTEDEPGVRAYRWYVDEDAMELVVSEEFDDEAAIWDHFDKDSEHGLFSKLRQVTTNERMIFLGEASERLRDNLAENNTEFYDSIAGFRR